MTTDDPRLTPYTPTPREHLTSVREAARTAFALIEGVQDSADACDAETKRSYRDAYSALDQLVWNARHDNAGMDAA